MPATRPRATLPTGVGLSIGSAEVTEEASDVMALIKVADERMYQNKRAQRRNRPQTPAGARRHQGALAAAGVRVVSQTTQRSRAKQPAEAERVLRHLA